MGEPVIWTMYTWYGAPVENISVLPKPENITPFQFDYIRIQLEDLETTARNKDVTLENGFPSIIDIPSLETDVIVSFYRRVDFNRLKAQNPLLIFGLVGDMHLSWLLFQSKSALTI